MATGMNRSAVGFWQRLESRFAALLPRQAYVTRVEGSTVWVRFSGEAATAPASQFPTTVSALAANTTGWVYPIGGGKGLFVATGVVASAGGTGAVDSVNGQTGVVVLGADDISDTSATHKFVTAADLAKLANTSGTNTGDQNLAPYALTSSLAGVATSGAYADLTGKPTIPTTLAGLDTTVTGAQLNALKTKVDGVASGATANSSDATLLNRANHTGTQSADTITSGTTNKVYTAAEQTKLAGIATGATANATDAQLRDRATHTGSQAISTVTGLQTALDAKADDTDLASYLTTAGAPELIRDTMGTALVAGTNVTITPNDAGDTITIAATSGGGGVTDHTLLTNIGTNTHTQIDTHIASTSNPHSVTKSQVGLANVDNTSDANKPVSTAQATAIGLKADTTALTSHTGATAAHGATGAVVGTTNTQTLTNKTLTTPSISSPTITGTPVGIYTTAQVDALIAANKPRVKRGAGASAVISTAGDTALFSGVTFTGLTALASYELSWTVTMPVWATASANFIPGVRITDNAGAAFHFYISTVSAYPGATWDVTATWGYSATVTANGSGEVIIMPAVRWVAGTTNVKDSHISATISRA